MQSNTTKGRPTGLHLSAQDISKKFGQVKALQNCSIEIRAGETLGLIGHNGAGKSTLVNVLVGLVARDEGTLIFQDEQMPSKFEPQVAFSKGIRCVFQELSLCGNLDAVENTLMVYSSLSGFGWRKRASKVINAGLEAVFPGANIPLDVPIGQLSIGQRQMIEIARAFSDGGSKPSVIILDEPTSSLDAEAAEQLMQHITRTRSTGQSVILISHKLNEVANTADRVVVMRDGTVAATLDKAEISSDKIFELMGGHDLALDQDPTTKARLEAAPVLFQWPIERADESTDPLVIKKGEVVGLAGLDGHGQRELLLDIFRKKDGLGEGNDAISMSYTSGDRQLEGTFPLWSIAENITIGALKSFGRVFISANAENKMSEAWFKNMNIRAPSQEAPILSLSGGNQQKVLVARAFASESSTLLLDDPTRGVDLGTKRELYARIREAAKTEGKTIIWYSTESEELAQCDRVIVLHEGAISAELSGDEIEHDAIIKASFHDRKTDPADDENKTVEKSALARWFNEDRVRSLIPIVALAALLIAIFAVRPNAASYTGIHILLRLSPVLMFAAIAQMFILTASDIDLGIGPFVAMVGTIAATYLTTDPTIGIMLLLLAILGYVLMGLLIHIFELPSILVTLAFSFVWLGLALTILPQPGGSVPPWLIGLMKLKPILAPMPIYFAVVLSLAGYFILKVSSIGPILRGFGNSPTALARAGRSPLKARLTLFALAGFFAVLAGLATAGLSTTGDANVGRALTLLSIAAVIIGGAEFFGGIVSSVGAVLGGVIMLLTGTFLTFMSVSAEWHFSFQGGLLLLILAGRSFFHRKKF